MSDFSKAIKLKPNLPHLYVNLGNVRSKLGFHNEAIADYNKALILKPDYIEAYYNRGILYKKIGLEEEALKDIEQVFMLSNTKNIKN